MQGMDLWYFTTRPVLNKPLLIFIVMFVYYINSVTQTPSKTCLRVSSSDSDLNHHIIRKLLGSIVNI
jgi:hypothetical protein